MTESSPEDRMEQETTAGADAAVTAPPDVPLEAPDADVVEQTIQAGPGEHVARRDAARQSLEVDAADAAEQDVVVELDEDEHR